MKNKLIKLLVILFMLTGCSSSVAKENKKIRIGVCTYDKYDPFVWSIVTNLQSNLSQYDNVSVDIKDAQIDQLTQNDQVKEMINNGYDVLCVNLVDRTAPRKIIDMAKNADIPIIFFNRELVDEDLQTWNKLYYVGGDANQSGKLEGELVVENWSEENDFNGDGIIQYVILEGEAGHQDATVRTKISVDTIVDSGLLLDRLDAAIANWNKSEAQSKVSEFSRLYGTSIELILSNNDEMALGAIEAYKASNISEDKWPMIVGIDGTETGLAAIEQGYMLGSVYNDAISQGNAMADLAYRLATNQSLEGLDLINDKYIRKQYYKIDISNVNYYLDLVSSQ